MKITCGACHASYNLPDEKVAGRRVKVRCKRCAEPIVVDGTSVAVAPPEEEDEATRVMDSPLSTSHMWTVNLSETEQGDMTDEELLAGWQAGVVTEDAYVWREGMDDWKPILEVPELISMLSQATQVSPLPESNEAEVPEPAPKKTELSPQAPRVSAAPKKPSGSSVIPKPAAPSPGLPRNNANLFAQQPKPKREKPKYEAATARNENSVLFSLEALKAAANEETAPRSTRVAEDLLTMNTSSSSELAPPDAPLIQVDVPKAEPAARRVSMGAGVQTFDQPRKGGKGWLVAVLAVCLLGGGGYYAYANFLAPQAAPTAEPPIAAVPTETPKEDLQTKPEPNTDEDDADKNSGEPEERRDEKGSKNTTVSADQKGSPSQGSGQTARSPSGSDGDSQKTNEPEDSPSTGSKTPSSSGDKSDDKANKDDDKDDGSAPPFNTEAARAALGGAASQAAACKSSSGPTGTGKVQVTFVNSGRVTSANVVSGPFGGTTVGGCVARTFRKARVPKFSGDAQTVSKSFTIPD